MSHVLLKYLLSGNYGYSYQEYYLKVGPGLSWWILASPQAKKEAPIHTYISNEEIKEYHKIENNI